MELQTEVQILNKGNLAEKVMFLSLEFNRFGNSRQADVEVANTTAQQGRFSHSKRLLDSPELKSIQKADNVLKLWIDSQPACWKYGKTMRVVGHEAVVVVSEICKQYRKVNRPTLVQAFLDVYLQQVAEAQAALGDKFVAKEYPTLEQVKAEFSFDYKLLSFSTPESLKTLNPEIFAEEKEKLAESFTLAVEDWKQGRRVILQEMVAHLLDILKPEEGKKKKLHATAVTKLQDFLTTFDLNSVPDDADLQADVLKLKQLMAGVDTDKIKESDNLKAALVEGFSAVNANMATLTVNAGRKFR
jgi:hypothetical protein